MSAPLVVALPGNENLAGSLAKGLDGDVASTEFRKFPDGESYVRLDTPTGGRSVVFVCTLDRPDEKVLPLLFAAATAREMGASKVGLVAPYLCYLRQDKRFKPGEAVTSALFARILSSAFDWLVTIDPHLHRVSTLDEIYTTRTQTIHAAPLIAGWIARHVPRALLIGPDAESEQWVAEIARSSGAPYVVLEKVRYDDRKVDITIPDLRRWRDRTPVLVDDIISSAQTMAKTLFHLQRLEAKPAVCIGVHAVFSPGAFETLQTASPAQIVTTNTILHPTNAIDVSELLTNAVRASV
jgi:ribose-phosphate pyrophosphokinase